MSNVNNVSARGPKAAFSDFDFIRIVISFIGDVVGVLNSLLMFAQGLINFPS